MMAGIGNPPYNDRDMDLVRRRGLATINPYQSIDPTYLQQTAPEYIFPEGAQRQRGRFELAFSQIGASCMAGAAFGGVGGFYNGFKLTTLAGQTGNVRRTQMLNHIVKQGSANANTLGCIAVMYSTFGVLLQQVRGADDELNTIAAATATGLLYKSTAGLPKCLIGGAVGLGLGLLASLWTSRDRLDEYQRHLKFS